MGKQMTKHSFNVMLVPLGITWISNGTGFCLVLFLTILNLVKMEVGLQKTKNTSNSLSSKEIQIVSTGMEQFASNCMCFSVIGLWMKTLWVSGAV